MSKKKIRQPKPWYWTARRGWYLEKDGRQHRLGDTEEEAQQRYHEVMADYGELVDGDTTTVAEAVMRFLHSKRDLAPTTVSYYEQFLKNRFAAEFGKKRMADITPTSVIAWIERHDNWNSTTRRDVYVRIRTLARWCLSSGMRGVDPFMVASPFRVMKRHRIITDSEMKILLDATAHEPHFYDLLTFIFGCGARPGEIAKLEKQHIIWGDDADPTVRAVLNQHKCARRTGEPRIIIFPNHLLARLKQLCEAHPTGPLLTNTWGAMWKQSAWRVRMNRLRIRCGLDKHVICYALRHKAITRLAASGVSLEDASKIAGNSKLVAFERYYRPTPANLKKQLDRVED